MAERHEESGARRVMKIVAMVLASTAMALSVLASGVGSHIQTQYQQEQWEQRVDEANEAYEHHLWDKLLAPSFWLDEGPAKDVDDSLKENEIRVGELDELGRATGVKAKLTKEGARYFDPERCWGLKADANLRGNWFDTGACLLDDVLRMRPRLKGLHVDIRLFIEHYGGGSWHQGDLQRQSAWLKQHESLWESETPAIEPPSA